MEGEVSNAKLYPSGHIYFTLKDDNAMMKAVVFNYYGKFPDKTLMKDGDTVTCEGKIDVYEKRGEYQLIVNNLTIKSDQGNLYLKFLALKEKLFKEGLFDEAKKKPLPVFPERIGIVTSSAGAAVRDILRIIYGKFENVAVEIYPVKVQGEEAPPEIVEGLAYFNKTKSVDVIIVGRGGGSLEDLAPFNEEIVARAIYASVIPVVSAVGHEIDFTIADFAADVQSTDANGCGGHGRPGQERGAEYPRREKNCPHTRHQEQARKIEICFLPAGDGAQRAERLFHEPEHVRR